ncbi:undecaprenyldiphospho-muramoylpentapeptide beta-N-acetylglucosaminyltransferase [Pseudalkalibacillus decolorationis]|uniref:undecaprenyldiphospho-muramoylpentapeptide beta-N-acetylglucosaminyltransferase n=1 Tax=Pseudalkalibacillus decolorationis TaxID=163879 RepID=UPI0021488A59|nr:undecaprenyldiphospho-muramoylpentapeptide beta-N-acetylglucosaminyltransferase [Pseudalkalibacillus decolorationis]
MKKSIVFTGGGSAGHVMVNFVLIPKFIHEGWDVHYIGSENGIEKQLMARFPAVQYYSVSTGKLRRYLAWNNVKDPFKVIKGILQSYQLFRKINADVVFSAGGFVAVPVVLGGWFNKVPVVIREPDRTLGLANKLSLPFATKVCTTFPETGQALKNNKTIHIGGIIRDDLTKGSQIQGFSYCGFTKEKPVLLIMGGSQGAQRINEIVRSCLDELLTDFQIVHICGKQKVDPSIRLKGYRQFEYINEELSDVMAMTDFVVSRAGSTAIFELLSLQKPMLLIPLSYRASRGEQIINAQSFQNAGYAEVLLHENLNKGTLIDAIYTLYQDREKYLENMKKNKEDRAIYKLMDLIRKVTV